MHVGVNGSFFSAKRLMSSESTLARRPDSLLDTAEYVARFQHLLDSKPRHGAWARGGFEARPHVSHSTRVAPPNEVTQYLRHGEVDIENSGRLWIRRWRCNNFSIPLVLDVGHGTDDVQNANNASHRQYVQGGTL